MGDDEQNRCRFRLGLGGRQEAVNYPIKNSYQEAPTNASTSYDTIEEKIGKASGVCLILEQKNCNRYGQRANSIERCSSTFESDIEIVFTM